MAPGPQPLGSLLTELLMRRGFARVQSQQAREAAWRQAVGEALAAHSRLGGLRRGVLEVTVAHAALAQELTYQKSAILTRLAELRPEETVTDLKVRTGAVQ